MSTTKTIVVQLPDSEKKVTYLFMPFINLYVVSDARGFGQNWVQVKFFRGIYETHLALGTDPDDEITSIARFLAEAVIKKKEKLAKINEEMVGVTLEVTVTFSISLRDRDPSTIRFVKQEFEKLL